MPARISSVGRSRSSTTTRGLTTRGERIGTFIDNLDDLYATGVISKAIMLGDTVEDIRYLPEPHGAGRHAPAT
jgi:hypothetical protein